MAAGHYFLRMSNVRLCWPPRFSGLWVKCTSRHRQQQPGALPPVKNAATSEAQMPVRNSQEFPCLYGYQVGLRPPGRGRVRQLDLDLRGHPQWVDSGQSGRASAPYTYCWLSSPQTTGCRIDSKVGCMFCYCNTTKVRAAGTYFNMVRTDLAPVVPFRHQVALRSVFEQKLLISACSLSMMI